MKRFLAVIMIFLLILSFSGCGEQKDGNVNNVTEVKEPDGNPQKGGSISIYSYKPDTLCPLLSNNNANIRMLGIVYDGLFNVDSNMSVSPCLASSWESYDNNTRYVVELKKNVLFHDGSIFNADDVVFSVNTALSNVNSPYYNNVSVIKEVKALGENKVEFILLKPLAKFVNLLDFPIIKNQTQPIDKENFAPVGTGGFIFENRNEGNLFHLVRNNDWWGGEVYLDSVTVRLLPDKDTAVYAFSSGEISICPAENDEWGKYVDAETSSYKQYMTERYNFIGLNHKNMLLTRNEVRSALLHIIDREEVLKSGVPGFSESSNAPFRNNWIYHTIEKSEKEKNLNKAREILEGSGWILQNGTYKKSDRSRSYTLKFDILVNEESYKKEQFAKKVAEELSDFGIPATITKLPYEKYTDAINRGKYDMFIGSVNLSKETDYEFWFKEGNMFSLEDKDLLASVQAMQLAKDEEDFGLKTADFIKMFNEKVPFIGIGFENSVLLYKSDIKGDVVPISNNIYNGIEKLYIKEES